MTLLHKWGYVVTRIKLFASQICKTHIHTYRDCYFYFIYFLELFLGVAKLFIKNTPKTQSHYEDTRYVVCEKCFLFLSYRFSKVYINLLDIFSINVERKMKMS